MAISSNQNNAEPQQRRWSPAAILGIHDSRWYPRAMLFAFVLGIVFPVALHVHYSKLNGHAVGSLAKQQWALFIGTVLAYLAQVSLVFAVRIVFMQSLWRALKRSEMSIGGIDSAFQAMSDPLVFLSKEVWRKTPLAMLVALISWLFPLTTFFAPATLNVEVVMRTTFALKPVPVSNINAAGSFQRYAFTVVSSAGHSNFRGARTIVSRLALASATTGALLQIPRPDTNATYEQVYYGPYVQCSNSTNDVRSQIDDMIQRFTTLDTPASSELAALDYFAAIPSLTNDTRASSIQVANLTVLDGARYASNQLWIRLRQYRPSAEFSTPANYRYLTCQLYNASYTMTLSWQNGIQNITTKNLTVLNPVPYPEEEKPFISSQLVAFSYSAVMSSLATQLTGSVSFYKDLTTNRMYSSIMSPVANTVLIGSSDFNSHFLQNHFFTIYYGSRLPENEVPAQISDQRQQDMDYVGARPLDVLISELSRNITINMLSDNLLAPRHAVNVSISHPATVYSYQFRNVAIIYPVAVFAAATMVALGIFIFHTEKTSHDNTFSATMSATFGMRGLDLSPAERLGAQPLLPATRRTLLYFDADGHDGSPGFQLVHNG